MRSFDNGRQTKEHKPQRAARTGFTPDPAIAKIRDRRNAAIEGAVLASPCVDAETFAGLLSKIDFAERQAIAVEQFGDFIGRRLRLLFGAALFGRLGAQSPDPLDDAA